MHTFDGMSKRSVITNRGRALAGKRLLGQIAALHAQIGRLVQHDLEADAKKPTLRGGLFA
jgi:hypothetical protein